MCTEEQKGLQRGKNKEDEETRTLLLQERLPSPLPWKKAMDNPKLSPSLHEVQ
jgi:hypothetical protein